MIPASPRSPRTLNKVVVTGSGRSVLRHTLKAHADTANSPLVRLAMGSVDKYGQGKHTKKNNRQNCPYYELSVRTYSSSTIPVFGLYLTVGQQGTAVRICLRELASALEARRPATRTYTVQGLEKEKSSQRKDDDSRIGHRNSA